MIQLLKQHLESGVQNRFLALKNRAGFERGDLVAGREYVKAYVQFVHYIEGLHSAMEGSGSTGASHETGHR